MLIQKIFQVVIRGFIISIVIFFALKGIEMAFGKQLVFDSALAREIGYYCIYGVSLTIINSLYFKYLNNEVVWVKYGKYRILIGAAGSILLSLIGIFFVRFFINVTLEGQDAHDFMQKEQLKFYIVPLIVTIIITLVFHLIYFYKALNEKKIVQQKIIAGTASAQFESLKNQIDPHFLFNSLNVLSSLIEENPENAQKFTTSLSKIYRYVLEQKDKELVSLEEELAFAKTYMNLLKMRFENSLFYELPQNDCNPEAKVVPLSLQLLLENTVKHNVVSETRPLHIRIFIKDDYLYIQNNLQKKEVLQDRRGVGLQNIVSRYAIITKKAVYVEQGEHSFTVKIPILTKLLTMDSTPEYNENNAYYRAKNRVEELKGFYGNLLSYCIIIPMLIFVNLNYSPEFHWFWFSVAGWGFGLTMHAFKVFGYSSKWEDRKIRQIMNKRENNHTWN
ncbi:histidine kinase [Flavobacterium pallidum]|uniref:Histidine kinase n=1 Tax=Flavobacterium pallidum TaxID=2172098 RepID=A0A2S1SI07_9FLAO|nr:histidine kinase [Flavobacterium pallidum]AWI26048.1 histidine kinase [Flavobacterium pallidum]